ncbi:MAG TPA: EAL domain-containing protein [Rhodopseudomonas sp.]|uniref:sensor domain-containing protein n=1 Tax=Rhodopseudomonas sp. TaxID=1078 RepID=UPI002EDB099F
MVDQNQQLVAALHNMPQGLCMFDGEQRIIVCNHKYAALYGLTPEMVTPGTRRRDMVERIVANGIRFADEAPESYLKERTEGVSTSVDKIHKLADGRIIAVARRPLAGGGWVATHEDITELKQREASFQLLFDNNPVPMWVYDRDTLRFLAVNQAAVEHYGYRREQFLTMSLPDLQSVAGDIGGTELRAMEDHVGATDWHAKADGGLIEVAVYSRRLRYAGAAAALVSVIDITERRVAERRIAHLAHHDMLTKLPNRAAFTERLDATIERAQGSGESFGLLFVDLDFFKEINDVFGHVVGDAFLCAASERLQRLAEDNFVARIGGDEFVIIAEGPQPLTASAVAERLIGMSSEQLELQGHKVEIGLSVGVALYPADGTDAKTLLANADTVLYRAKEDGRGRACFFDPQMDSKIQQSHALLRDLRQAVERDELLLYYQPQAVVDGEVIGFEALLRWRHETRGMISPAEFIPLAEESGLIDPIGEWVLREACREAASWPQPLSIAVNLSPVQFQQRDLPQLVHRVLLESGLAPSRLELEITEGVLLSDSARALSLLRRLKALGVQIALDDFGTGYSSLSYLQSFPFDKIKIDAKFVRNLGANPQSSTILRAVIALGHGLDMSVIAEGVETEEQYRFLAQQHCDQVQGYLIGRPLPVAHYDAAVGRAPYAEPGRALG